VAASVEKKNEFGGRRTKKIREPAAVRGPV
jgi:hypothetical protein